METKCRFSMRCKIDNGVAIEIFNRNNWKKPNRKMENISNRSKIKRAPSPISQVETIEKVVTYFSEK